MIDPVVAWLARVALASVFAAAALHKWRAPAAFAAALAAHELVPGPLVPVLARAFAVAETAVAVGLFVPGLATTAGSGAAALLGVYSGAIALGLARGRRDLDCGCSARRQPLSPALLVRNAALLAAVAPAVVPVLDRSLSWVDALSLAGGSAVLALAWLAVQSLAFGGPLAAGAGRSS